MIYLDAGATTLQKPPAVALAVQSAMRRMATPGRGGHPYRDQGRAHRTHDFQVPPQLPHYLLHHR